MLRSATDAVTDIATYRYRDRFTEGAFLTRGNNIFLLATNGADKMQRGIQKKSSLQKQCHLSILFERRPVLVYGPALVRAGQLKLISW